MPESEWWSSESFSDPWILEEGWGKGGVRGSSWPTLLAECD